MKACVRNVLSVLTLTTLAWNALPLAARAADTDLVFSAGRKDSGYWGVANRLKKVAGEAGLKVEVQASVGSLQNLERLEDPTSPVNLALTQSDALHQYLQQHPDFAHGLSIMESIGLECVFLITPAGSGVQAVADLTHSKGFRIAIPGAESGVAVTYRDLKAMNPAFADTEAVYTDPATAMQALGGQGGEKIDALMLVHRPKERTPEIQLAIDSPDKFRFVSFTNQWIEAKLPDGQPIFSFLDLPLVRKGMRVEKSVPTLCTNGLLVSSNSKIKPEQRKALDRVVDEQWMRIYVKDN